MKVINKIRERRDKARLEKLNDSFVDHTVELNRRIADNSAKKSGRFTETYADAMFMSCIQGAMISCGVSLPTDLVVNRANDIATEAMRIHSDAISIPRKLFEALEDNTQECLSNAMPLEAHSARWKRTADMYRNELLQCKKLLEEKE